MKNLEKIALFVFAGAFLVTCKKAETPSNTVVGQPVFSFAGTINSNSVNLQAGVNNYYMYSSYSQSAAGVYSFTGNLQNTNTKANSIQITINDYKVSSLNGNTFIDTSLVPAYYSLNKPGGNPTSDTVRFVALPDTGVTPSSYLWSFGDGSYSSNANPIHIYKHPGDYHTSLNAGLPTCGNEKDSNIVKMGTQDANTNIIVFSVSKDSLGDGRRMDFNVLYLGTPTKFIWYFGDTKDTNTNTSPTAKHEYLTAGMYTVMLEVTDVNGNISVYNENIVTSGYSESCVINYLTFTSPLPNPNALSNVTINYTDGSGIVYTSDSLQSSSSFFQITSVSDYQKNTSNESTKMLKVKFNCLLFNSGANPPSISASGTAVMAVAYPSQ